MTEVVNIRNVDKSEIDVYIDRRSKFGNPFKLAKDGGEFTREGSIEAYQAWFLDKIDEDPEFRESVKELEGKTLGCWCKPKACHGDVIVEFLDG